jgi:hypothetical protein
MMTNFPVSCPCQADSHMRNPVQPSAVSLPERVLTFLDSRDSTNPKSAMSDFTPPANFHEFVERFPELVENRIATKWSGLQEDRSDLVQDVYLHLMMLPEESIYRAKGCEDRIATFDPSALPECSKGLFFGYIHRIIDNYVQSSYARIGQRLIRETDSISDLAGSNADEASADDESILLLLSGFAHMPYDSEDGLYFEELLDIAFAIDPAIAYAGCAVAAFDTKVEAASFLQIPVPRLDTYLRNLGAIAEGNWATVERAMKFRGKKVGRKRRGQPYA